MTHATDYAIGDAAMTDPSICDFLIRDSRREVYLNGRRAGTAMLTLWDSEGTQRDIVPITVTPVNFETLEAALRHELQDIGTIRLRRESDRLIIEGEVKSQAVVQRLANRAATDPHLESQVTLAHTALATVAAEIERAVGRPGITVRRVRDRLVLEGLAYSRAAATHAEAIAKIYHPQVMNLVEVQATSRTPGRRPMIHLDVYFVEIKRDALKAFGVTWQPGATRDEGQQGLGGLVTSTLGFLVDLLPKIRLARERGAARILEHPTLIIKSGDRGEFFSGVEIPFTTEQQVAFKEVGMTVRAVPIALGQEVDLEIHVEVAAPSAGVDGAIDRRRVATTAYARSGESIVLGGLWGSSHAATRNRVPKAARGSPLFALALSKDVQQRESEFVVFLTPRVVAQAPSGESWQQQWNAWKPRTRTAAPNPPPSPRPRASRARVRARGSRRWRRRDVPRAAPHSTTPSRDPATVIALPASLVP
jgi:Flp pilus assembly secretin CpaC